MYIHWICCLIEEDAISVYIGIVEAANVAKRLFRESQHLFKVFESFSSWLIRYLPVFEAAEMLSLLPPCCCTTTFSCSWPQSICWINHFFHNSREAISIIHLNQNTFMQCLTTMWATFIGQMWQKHSEYSSYHYSSMQRREKKSWRDSRHFSTIILQQFELSLFFLFIADCTLSFPYSSHEFPR